MILRIFRVIVQDGKRDEFKKFFLETAIPLMAKQPGLVSITHGLPRKETPDEFCMAMVWQDLDALKAFVGEDWLNPHIHEDEAVLVKERYIHHYEVV